MDPRITRIRRKLARIPYEPERSHSFGEEKHQFRRGPTLTTRQLADFEQRLMVGLPRCYRDFLLHVESCGASPFYGIMPPERCRLFMMSPRRPADTGRGFSPAADLRRPGDLFLDIIEAGCSDVVMLGVTGPLTGRVVVGNADGFWGPDLSTARDFLAWYERWLDMMAAGRDDCRLHLRSPGVMRLPQRSGGEPTWEPSGDWRGAL